MKIVQFLFVALVIYACQKKCVRTSTSDAFFKSYYVHKQLVRVERFDLEKNRTSIQYYSEGKVLDSIFIFDTIQTMVYSCHYAAEKMIMKRTYWPNKNPKEVLMISSMDTVSNRSDSIRHAMVETYLYNGYMYVYDANRKLKEEGGILRNQKFGKWIYYDEDGKVKVIDTVNKEGKWNVGE